MATNYTTKTASLKATTADIRILNAKNITAKSISIVNGDTTTNVSTELTSLDARIDDLEVIKDNGVISDVTASTTAQAAGITVAPKSEGSTVREIAVATGVIGETETKVVTGATVHAAIKTAKQEAISGAKVVVAKGTGINVTASDDNLTYTVAVDDTIATKAAEITQQSVSGAGITVTLGGTVGVPTLTGSVTTATYTPATEDAAGSWSEDTKVAKASDVKAAIADVATAHGKDIQILQTAVNNLTTTGLTRKVLPDDQTTADITDPKENIIYLVKDTTNAEAGSYIEYLYVDGVYEAIGSTKTDLSEYAKTADVNAAIADIPTVEVVAAEGTTEIPNYVTVSSKTADGKTTFTVASTGALETRLDTLESFIGGSDTPGQGLSELLAKKVDNVTGGTNGITITTADSTDGRIATLTVTPDTTVTKDSANVITSGAVETAISNLKTTTDKKVESITTPENESRIIITPSTTDDVKSVEIKLAATVATSTDGSAYSKSETEGLVKTAQDAADAAQETADQAVEDAKAAQDTADAKIAAVEVTTDATTHFGAQHISAETDENKTVTINVTHSDEWSVDNDNKPATSITSVINGKMSDGSTIDDANLIDGTSMFAGNIALTTYIGDLSKLTNGEEMFSGCTALETFVGNLGSLTNGTDMFAGCKLTEESLIYIIDSLPTVQSGTITVGVADGVDKSSYATEASEKGWTLA